MRHRCLIFVPLPALLTLVFFSASITQWYFERVELPQLLAPGAGYVAKGSFQPTSAEHAPAEYDLASKERLREDIKERYVSAEGNTTAVLYSEGKWISTETECRSRSRQFYFTLAGFLLFGIGTLLQSIRTGQWFYLPGRSRPSFNRRELVLIVYGGSIFIATMLAPGAPCVG